MNNHEKQLSELKNNLERAKNLKYKAEARLETLNKQQEELILELKELDVDPNDLDSEINNLENEITDLFKKANDLLPMDILDSKLKE